jgi:hypothetical protein
MMDSPLSIAASVTSFLTIAAAITAFIYVRFSILRNGHEEMTSFLESALASAEEITSLKEKMTQPPS